jgi:hypothetical protein
VVRFEKLERSDALVIYEKDNMTSIKSYEKSVLRSGTSEANSNGHCGESP